MAQFAYLFYDRVQPEIRAAIDEYENENVEMVKTLDARALKMVENGNESQARRMFTEWCQHRSQYLFDKWTDLGNYLLVKYMDGNVKRQNPDGTFQSNGSGKPIPESPIHPKFRERWLRGVVKDHGDVMEVKK